MTDDVDDFLAHYGVKGMKWGVRRAASKVSSSVSSSVKDVIRKSNEKRQVKRAERAENHEKARAAGYTSQMRNADIQSIGSRGTRRVEKRIANGERVNTARFKESVASFGRGLAIGTAIISTPIAIGAASQGLSNLASSVSAKRGAEAARNLLADSKGLTSYKTISLAFDETKKSWS